MAENCVFCRIILGEIKCEKIFENDNFIVINDISPQTKGHCLIVPKKHFENLIDMDESLYFDLLKTVKEVAIKLNKNFNLVVNNGKDAGQIINHLHVHIIPRTYGDGFRVSI